MRPYRGCCWLHSNWLPTQRRVAISTAEVSVCPRTAPRLSAPPGANRRTQRRSWGTPTLRGYSIWHDELGSCGRVSGLVVRQYTPHAPAASANLWPDNWTNSKCFALFHWPLPYPRKTASPYFLSWPRRPGEYVSIGPNCAPFICNLCWTQNSGRQNIAQPLIIGIGGTASPLSSTEQALNIALESARAAGAHTVCFGGEHLCSLPHYLMAGAAQAAAGRELVEAVRAADGLVLASPGYHGSISGLVKNAIDYLEETAKDTRVYLDGVPVGLIATAYGWQATGSTLATLRSIVHSLRGWPTPLGAAINSSGGVFTGGVCSDQNANRQLELVGRQVCEFARLRLSDPRATETAVPEL